jgi:hypothetical protein
MERCLLHIEELPNNQMNLKLKGDEKIYYCRYGFVDDPDVYAK